MASDENIWRNLINSYALDLSEDGEGPPEMESIVPSKKRGRRPARKYLVQKLVTHIYVYTDMEKHTFASPTFQDLTILGEMTGSKLEKLINAERHSRHSPEED